ncbi:MAG: signal peptidase II [Candidatus Peribacteraceae bacterium]|jgi:signal peptidase II|nr:signal peptidase II [Candidatus Peribacteraceae bacterium]
MKTLWITVIITLICSVFAAMAADIYLSARIPIIGAFAGLQYSLNPGIAWGIRLPSGAQEVAILLALIAVGYMAKSAKSSISQAAFGLIIGGGLANIVDRIRDGVVTDFFQIGSFPIFNVADSCVSIGVGLLLVEAFLSKSIKG